MTREELIQEAKSRGVNLEEKALALAANLGVMSLSDYIQYELTITYLEGFKAGVVRKGT
jgi:type III secretion system FlhB-like substrate exporter